MSEYLHLRSGLRAAIALRRRAARIATKCFLVEGLRELRVALNRGCQIEALFCCETLYKGELDEQLVHLQCPRHNISARDFARLTYREASGGLVAVLKMQSRQLSSLSLPKTPFLLVLDNIEKPGNTGAILRTAAAAGTDALLFCGKGDPYNPNVVRNSLGALFIVPWVETTASEVQAWTQKHDIQLLGLDPKGSLLYTEAKLQQATALVLGAEASGLHPNWRSRCSHLLRLPMREHGIDSLNVASSAAIVSYEALRQRNTHTAANHVGIHS